MDQQTTRNPQTFFNYPACISCLDRPCMRLRLGAVLPGKYQLVASRLVGKPYCPFVCQDPWEVEQTLLDTRLPELILETDFFFGDLSPAAKLNYNINSFVTDFDDKASRVAYLLRLWQDDLLVMARIPYNYEADEKLRRWLYTERMAITHLAQAAEEANESVLTDELIEEEQKIRLFNPRWEHADTQRAKSSPDSTTENDSIYLKAQVEGIPDGASVQFDIFDPAETPRTLVEGIKGTVEDGVAVAEWTVTDPRPDDASGNTFKLEFEASARGKKCDACEIPVEVEEFVLSI
ncbi:MAG: hypothetical protein GF398_07150 [Chitinivibrionales bacterium]|nr:hypothetical protein [Chitinivibrionales bacterium]